MPESIRRSLMEFKAKIVLVTGAGGRGSGQGKAFALAFAAEGADVAVNDIDLADAELFSAVKPLFPT
jgi:NAD(P)-dependent dehydrogenase (short-subunit alcohol dehydrogenase family)